MPRLGKLKLRSKQLGGAAYFYSYGRGWNDPERITVVIKRDDNVRRWKIEIDLGICTGSICPVTNFKTKKAAVNAFTEYAQTTYKSEGKEEDKSSTPELVEMTAEDLILEIFLWSQRYSTEIAKIQNQMSERKPFDVLIESISNYVYRNRLHAPTRN